MAANARASTAIANALRNGKSVIETTLAAPPIGEATRRSKVPATSSCLRVMGSAPTVAVRTARVRRPTAANAK